METLESRVRATPRLRAVLESGAVAGESCIVTGRPEAWRAAAAVVAAASAEVIAFHQVRGLPWRRRFDGRPVLHGPLDATVPVVFAGAPTKAWFNPAPPGPERCLWHTAPPDWQLRGRHSPALLDARRDELRELHDSLEDDASRDTLAAIVRARLEGDTGFHRVAAYREYDHPVVRAAAGDVVIDAGAYDGDTATMFGWQIGPAGKVLALEPSPANAARLRQRARRHPFRNIVPIELGAWSERATLRFEDDRDGSSRVTTDGKASIEVTSIDALVAERGLHRVDLLKMDIEGAEAHALRGAATTIRRHRPKLQISIYHRSDDLFELPALVRSLADGYRCFLGHHSYYQMETDLYAIPREHAPERQGALARAGRWFERRVVARQ